VCGYFYDSVAVFNYFYDSVTFFIVFHIPMTKGQRENVAQSNKNEQW